MADGGYHGHGCVDDALERGDALEGRPLSVFLCGLEEFRKQIGHPTLFAPKVKLDARAIALIRQHQQIFERIAGAVAISMMDEFPWQKWTVQEVFCNFSVQQR